jgi:hypothetical protein
MLTYAFYRTPIVPEPFKGGNKNQTGVYLSSHGSSSRKITCLCPRHIVRYSALFIGIQQE